METAVVRVREVKVTLQHKRETTLQETAGKKLNISLQSITGLKIIKKAVDARQKNNILLVFTLDVKIDKKCLQQVIKKSFVTFPVPAEEPEAKAVAGGPGKLLYPPVVVGTGPAGLFAALMLAVHGYRPLVFERGAPVGRRTREIHHFWQGGELNFNSNVQFGEGGAGTFSDGKLTTRIKDRRTSFVLTELVKAGAPEQIFYEQKAHLGTDNLARIVRNLRAKIISLGGRVFFGSRLTGLFLEHNQVSGIEINEKWQLPARLVVLAIGHSARDTYEMLVKRGIRLEQKPFAMGVRIEHPQQLIDQAQYGSFAGHSQLGPADYQLTHQSTNWKKTAYTFCMCPGGCVVAAASEKNGVVTNGMSNYARNSSLANSGLVVSVGTDDFPGDKPLAGVALQRGWENKAFQLGGKNYFAPAQTVADFLADRDSSDLDTGISPSYRPGVTPANLNDLLPKWAGETMAEALVVFGRKLTGFDTGQAVLTGVETRTSAPVRILRDDTYQAVGLDGLYPAGEGAGYAGGIMSAAVDGVRVTQAMIANYARPIQDPVIPAVLAENQAKEIDDEQ